MKNFDMSPLSLMSISERPKYKGTFAGLPLGGRTPYITPKNRLRTPKLHIRDVPRTSENSLVRPKMDIETSCLQKNLPTFTRLRDLCPAFVLETHLFCLLTTLGRPTWLISRVLLTASVTCRHQSEA